MYVRIAASAIRKIWHSKSSLEMKYSTWLCLMLYLSLAYSFACHIICIASTHSNALTLTYVYVEYAVC